jgi:hypothetical protein
VRLPRELYEQARSAVKQAGTASSINDFLIEALQEKLRQLREREIDRAFAEMGKDEEYQNEAVSLARSFAHSDWEAYKNSSARAAHDERPRKKGGSKTAKR